MFWESTLIKQHLNLAKRVLRQIILFCNYRQGDYRSRCRQNKGAGPAGGLNNKPSRGENTRGGWAGHEARYDINAVECLQKQARTNVRIANVQLQLCLSRSTSMKDSYI